MLDWISDTIMEIVTFVPALIVDRQSPHFALARTMFGLLLIAAIVYAFAMMPSRLVISNFIRRLSESVRRK
jgi:hypothetical protein